MLARSHKQICDSIDDWRQRIFTFSQAAHPRRRGNCQSKCVHDTDTFITFFTIVRPYFGLFCCGATPSMLCADVLARTVCYGFDSTPDIMAMALGTAILRFLGRFFLKSSPESYVEERGLSLNLAIWGGRAVRSGLYDFNPAWGPMSTRFAGAMFLWYGSARAIAELSNGFFSSLRAA